MGCFSSSLLFHLLFGQLLAHHKKKQKQTWNSGPISKHKNLCKDKDSPLWPNCIGDKVKTLGKREEITLRIVNMW